jgi:hypothetical protein
MSKYDQKTESLDERIAALEAEIEALQRRWKPYINVQPVRIGQPNVMGGGTVNPTLFLQKSETSIAIDRKQIALARLKHEQGTAALAAFTGSGALTRAEDEVAATEGALGAAKRALREAEIAWGKARQNHERQREQCERLTRAVRQAAFDERRWTKELVRDRQLMENAGGTPSEAA